MEEKRGGESYGRRLERGAGCNGVEEIGGGKEESEKRRKRSRMQWGGGNKGEEKKRV